MATVREKISPSALNTWYTCPYSFYCKYIANRPTIKTPDTAMFGQTVHRCIEHYYDMATVKTKRSEVYELLEKAFTTGGNYSTTSRKQATRKAKKSVQNFEEKRISDGVGMPTVQEDMLEAQLREDLPIIRGKPDVYFEETGEVIDWKTGNYPVLNDSLKVQGKVYELLLRAHGYNPKRIIFDFIVVGKRVILPTVNTGWLVKQVERVVSSMNSQKYNPTPNTLCERWCEYRLSCDLRNCCIWRMP